MFIIFPHDLEMRQQSYSAFVTRFLVLTSFLSSSPPSLLLAMAICSLMSSLFFLLSSASASSRLMASASCSCSSSSPWVWGLEQQQMRWDHPENLWTSGENLARPQVNSTRSNSANWSFQTIRPLIYIQCYHNFKTSIAIFKLNFKTYFGKTNLSCRPITLEGPLRKILC